MGDQNELAHQPDSTYSRIASSATTITIRYWTSYQKGVGIDHSFGTFLVTLVASGGPLGAGRGDGCSRIRSCGPLYSWGCYYNIVAYRKERYPDLVNRRNIPGGSHAT
jgi:hypothetical protein